MSKKNLLNESQVRQFMKLAKLEPLTPGFVMGIDETQGRGVPPGEHDRGIDNTTPGRRVRIKEEDEEAQMHDLEDADADMDHAEDLEDDAEEDLGDVDMEPAGRTIDVDDFLSALETALEGVLGDEVEIDSDEMEDDLEPEAEDDFAPEGDEVVADIEMEDEVMEEGTDEEVTTEGTDEELEEEKKQGEKDHDDEAESARLGAISHDTGLKGSKKKKQKSRRDDVLGVRGTRTKKNESTDATDDLVEQITKRVAARILKSALTKK